MVACLELASATAHEVERKRILSTAQNEQWTQHKIEAEIKSIPRLQSKIEKGETYYGGRVSLIRYLFNFRFNFIFAQFKNFDCLFIYFFASKLDDLGWSIFQHFAESPLTAKYIDKKFTHKLAEIIREDNCHLRAMAYLVTLHKMRHEVKFTFALFLYNISPSAL